MNCMIKEGIVINNKTKEEKIGYLIYDSLGFIFSFSETLKEAIGFCKKNKDDYQIMEV